MEKHIDIQNIYKLSAMQQDMFYHYLNNKGDDVYVNQIEYRIDFNLDIPKLKSSFEKLVQRHDVLRTCFVQKNNEMLQVVLKDRKALFQYFDFCEELYPTGKLEDFKNISRRRGFDLKKDSLFRLSVIRLGKMEYSIIAEHHHIILDGWSVSNLFRELFGLYFDQRLKPAKQFNLYIKWLQKRKLDDSIVFWKNYLKECNELCGFGMIKRQNKSDIITIQEKSLTLHAEDVSTVKKIAFKNNSTVRTVLVTIWGLMATKLNDCSDVTFGMVVSGRPQSIMGCDEICGLFINTVPIRVKIDEQVELDKLIQKQQEEYFNIEKNAYVNLADIQRTVEKRLVEYILVYENYPPIISDMKMMDAAGVQIKDNRVTEKGTYPLTIVFVPGDDEIKVSFQYNQNIYSDENIDLLIKCYEHVIQSIVTNENVDISRIELISDEEKEQQVNVYTESVRKVEGTVLDAFNNTVELYENEIAVFDDKNRLTYAQLDKYSNQVANLVAPYIIGNSKCIGVMLERSVSLYICLWGIIKVGGIYVPIDPIFPDERVKYMIEDCGAQIVFTQSNFRERFHDYTGKLFEVSVENKLLKDISTTFQSCVEQRTVAYLIYTSGSTGKPKGVAVNHGALKNRIDWENKHFPLSKDKKMILKTSISFDVSIYELFTPVFTGSSLYMLKQGAEKDAGAIIDAIDKHKISSIHFVPSMFGIFLEYLRNNSGEIGRLKSLEYVFTSGESLLPDHVNLFHQLFLNIDTLLVNKYGPTEATVDVTCYICKREQISCVPIGKGIDNVGIFVVDKNMNLIPQGMIGELCIAGICLADGYINNPMLTKEKFVTAPFLKQERMYRTGDLCRIMADGNIEYLGRMDRQVKVRGYRIELEEIESNLLKIDEIKNTVVLKCEIRENDESLVAYYILRDRIIESYESRVFRFREQLNRQLPEYMIPTLFIELEEFPILSNGKIDKEKLANPYNYLKLDSEEKITDTESQLAQVWAMVFQISVDVINRNSNFILLGGHSLLAIRLANQINQSFELAIRPSDIFRNPVLKDLSMFICESQRKRQNIIRHIGKREYYPIAPAQKRIFVLQKMSDLGLAYNIINSYELEGHIEWKMFYQVWIKLMQRHEILRAKIDLKNEEIVQIIEDTIGPPIYYFDIKEQTDEVIRKYIQPINMEQAPLFKVYFFRVNEDKYILVLQFHHIIVDGVSVKNLVDDFYKMYNKQELEELPISYVDYACWQNSKQYVDWIMTLRTYWLDVFKDDIPVLNLETDFSRPAIMTYEGDMVKTVIKEKIGNQIEGLCKEYDITTFTYLLTCFYILIYKYTGNTDIIVGIPVSGRTQNELEHLVGMFVNTVCIRGRFQKEDSAKEMLERIKETLLEAIDHSEYPFEKLVADLKVAKDPSRNPLFSIAFSYMEYELMEGGNNREFVIKPCYYNKKSAQFDLSFDVVKKENNEILVEINYRTDLFKHSTMVRMLAQYCKLIEEVLDNPNKCIDEIEFRTEEDIRWLTKLYEKVPSFSDNNTLIEHFMRIVKKYPSNIAVHFENVEYTYDDINKMANQVANCLYSKGIKEGDVVALLVKRSPKMIAVILGILKVGGTYLPIDNSCPEERLSYILEDSKPSYMILQEHDFYYCEKTVKIDFQEISQYSTENIEIVSSSDRVAYIIYTSGTTGNPKGVQITHRNVVSLFTSSRSMYDFNMKDVWTLYHNYCFDFSVWEMFGALLNGGKLVIVSEDVVRDPVKFMQLLVEQKVTVLNQTPTAFYQMANIELSSEKSNYSLRYVIFGGEALKPVLLKQWHARYPKIQIVNMYGITETTIHSTIKKLDDGDFEVGTSNIGKAIPSLRVYVMDEHKRLCPPGIVGEICVEGYGVAKGYLNHPELTEEKFIHFSGATSSKLYCSNDLGKLLENGDIVYIGRKDKQVKIRGYRVELGEIEQRILMCKYIRETAVIMIEDEYHNFNIWAFYTADCRMEVKDIRKNVQRFLPNYMIPSHFVEVDEIPITINGKINYKQLEKIAQTYDCENDTESGAIIENSTLFDLLRCSARLLQNNQIHSEDSFFDVGGDSIKVIQLKNMLNKLGYEINIHDIFIHSKFSDMVMYISKNLEETKQMYDLESNDFCLTPVQYWFFEQNLKNMNYYNQSTFVKVSEKIDIGCFRQAIVQVLSKHKVFQTRFSKSDDSYKQVYVELQEDMLYGLKVIDIDNLDEYANYIYEQIKEMQQTLDIEEGQVIRICVIHTNSSDYLYFVIHHLYIDAISWGIFLEDLEEAYECIKNDNVIIHSQKIGQYSNWSQKVREIANQDIIVSQVDFWKDMLNCERVFSGKKERITTYEDAKKEQIRLPKRDTRNVLYNISSTYEVMPRDILLAALARTVYECFRVENVIIFNESHGREQIGEGINIYRTIGWFTALYPVKICGNEDNTEILLKSIVKTMNQIPMYGIGYGILKYLTDSKPLKDIEEVDEICFNYLGNQYRTTDNRSFSIEKSGGLPDCDPKNKMFYCIEINCSIIDEELIIDFTYDTNVIRSDQIQEFTNKYSCILHSIIQKCCAEEAEIDVRKCSLPSIRPYNDVFFYDCFYNMLFSVLQGYNSDIRPFLANQIDIYEQHENGYLYIKTKSKSIIDSLLIDLGMEVKTKKKCNDVVRQVCTAVKENKVCIIQIDAYYLPHRKDTYHTEHWPHALAIYGYDNEKEEFLIIDHTKKNKLDFHKTTMEYNDLEASYLGYLEQFYKMGSITYVELRKNRVVPFKDRSFYQESYINFLKENKQEIMNGLKKAVSYEWCVCEVSDKKKIETNRFMLEQMLNSINILALQNEILLDGFCRELILKIKIAWLKINKLTVRLSNELHVQEDVWRELRDALKKVYQLEMEYFDELITK